MVASISLNRIKISAVQKIYLYDLSWEEFEQILLELGEKTGFNDRLSNHLKFFFGTTIWH